MGGLPEDLDRLLHDLRGPLNAMQMHVELLKRLDVGEPAALASLESIAQEVSRLATMLPAAFHVMAVELHEREAHDLRAIVETALAEHELRGVVVAPGPWPRVPGDARLLRLAVAHLIRNALAADGGRAPEIDARDAGDSAVLIVRDWGSGLRTTNPRALIRLGYRPGDRPRVGLVTVERVARLHGGRIEFATPPGGGTEVRLTLPAAGS
ncbi:MAG TPA: HAMP domain-containing sensor histidine kinase [Methylomirabilota bacterium]|nr:HAMP domain-containing sensor histidine kinase [Methylomirabilota bacterium]